MENKKNFVYPHIDMKKTGSWLRCICKQRRVSVRDLQEALHISSNQAIYDWFNGKTLPSLDNFYALSKLLKISMEKLIIADRFTQERYLLDSVKEDKQSYRLITYYFLVSKTYLDDMHRHSL